MQRLQFESSPFFILLCIALGVGYAFVLYRSKHSWSKRINQLLFALRACLVALLAFLLIGPILKIIVNQFEKPSIVFLLDNSTSIKEAVDSTKRSALVAQLYDAKEKILKEGYEVVFKDLKNKEVDEIIFNQAQSDLSTAIKNIATAYEGKNLKSIVLVSDGIYNSGASPIYNQRAIPIFTVGVGDTTEHADLILRDVAYNKVVYQGNKFPIRAEVLTQDFEKSEVIVSVSKNSKILLQQQKHGGSNRLTYFDFLIEATEKGIQRYDISIEPIAGEATTKNNRISIFVEVVEGKKKILMIAPAPHPDIKAIRSVVEQNANYEFNIHIPGVAEVDPQWLKPGNVELAIFHQAADRQNKTTPLLQLFQKGNSAILLILGSQSNLRQLPSLQLPITFENNGQRDNVTPVVNTSFRNFNLPDNTSGIFSKYPPIEVPLGKFNYPQNASILLFQRIGSVATDRPLVFSWEGDNQKMAAIMGEGIWQWRLSEFGETEGSQFFDDVFLKLIQYLSTLNDKRKFKSFPTQAEFSETSAASIESQVYNDLFEPVYGNTISIELSNEQNQVTTYQYVTSPGGSRYEIGGLTEGIYRFKSTTDIEGKKEFVNGQFLVRTQNVEAQNFTADFGLLKKLATATGGEFYKADQIELLTDRLRSQEKESLIHTNESTNPLINLKWFFFLLLLIVSAEWFLRKYLGGY
jgi:hypothetical protein